MTFEEKIAQLRGKIEEALLPLIDNDYVLWDCPYYSNIGDILIWQGELEFLQNTKCKCLGYASKDTCRFPKLPENVIILLQGGGNFGDLWKEHQEFRLQVVQAYPNNRIIVFPQTVFYQDEDLMQRDAQIMGEHKHLVLCARDQKSYELLQKDFTNTVLLLPDMAFCISTIHKKKSCCVSPKRGLYLNRSDKEFADNKINLPENLESHDWPTYERRYLVIKILNGLLRVKRYCNSNLLDRVVDFWAYKRLRCDLINTGVSFLAKYDIIYTTRLHVLILSILLGIECYVIDNNYGKCINFYQAWLEDLQCVNLLR